MKLKSIKYKSGYKYQLNEVYSIDTGIFVSKNHHGEFLIIKSEGTLIISKGYAWDGASGPAIDTKNFMRASLVHDAIYQLMRAGVIDKSHREKADKLMKKMCKEDGMNSVRAWLCYQAVRKFGGSAINKKKAVKVAP